MNKKRLLMTMAGNIFRWNGDSVYFLAKKTTSSTLVNVALLGDSITVGVGSSDYSTKSYAGLSRLRNQSVYGNGGYGIIPAHRTDLITYSGNWSEISTWGNGSGMRSTADVGATATFTAYGDNLDIYTLDNVGRPDFTITVDGGDPITVEATQALGEVIHNVSLGTLGSHTVVLTTGGQIYLDCFSVNIGTVGMRINNCGRSGGNITTFSSTELKKYSFDLFLPKLSVIMLGTNDYGAQIALATFEAGLIEVIAYCKPGSVLLVSDPLQSDQTKVIKQPEYNEVMKSVAAAQSCGYVSIPDYWGTYTQANAAGYMADTLHPSDAGHANIATILRKYIL